MIILVIDGLSTHFLNPYGNVAVDTPSMNRMAANGIVFHNFHTDSVELDLSTLSSWTGRHAVQFLRDTDQVTWSSLLTQECLVQSLPALAKQADRESVLLTDCDQVFELGGALGWSQIHKLQVADNSTPAKKVEETYLAQAFAAAIERITQLDKEALVWIQLRGLNGSWDAPEELRNQFVGEGDPEAPSWTQPPARDLKSDIDPDEYLSYTQVYSAQMLLLDQCLEHFQGQLAESSIFSRSDLILMSLRGYAVGAHGRAGVVRGLYSDLVHLPLIWTGSELSGSGQSVLEIVQPDDLLGMISRRLGWSNTAAERAWKPEQNSIGNTELKRDRAIIVSRTERAIRTANWYRLQAGDQYELYVKPDDRHENNNIERRLRQVGEVLDTTLEDAINSLKQNVVVEAQPPLDKLLLNEAV